MRRILGMIAGTLLGAMAGAAMAEGLEARIAGLQLIGLPAGGLTAEARAAIAELPPGGFVLRPGEDFYYPEELARLAGELRAAAAVSAGPPPLIGVVHAPGVFTALHPMLGGAAHPGNFALGRSGRAEDAEAVYMALGRDLRACGANLALGPLLDIAPAPGHAAYARTTFGSDPARNGALGAAAIAGLHASGVAACVRHFPPLPAFPAADFPGVPRLAASPDELTAAVETTRAALAAGPALLMTAHVIVPAWDPNYPVTLSERVISGIIRGDLGFDGVVATAALDDPALGGSYRPEQSAVRALEAGCDLVHHLGGDWADYRARIDAIAAAVRSGRIPEGRIDAAHARVLALRQARASMDAPAAAAEVFAALDRPEEAAALRRAALNGVRVIRDPENLLPLPIVGRRVAVVCPPSSFTLPASAGGGGLTPGHTLGRFVRAAAADAIEIRVHPDPAAAEARHALEKAEAAEVLVIGLFHAAEIPAQRALTEALLALGKPAILVALGHPADLDLFSEEHAAIAAHGIAQASVQAAAQVLFGEAPASAGP